jgi:predicted 2-oxoglutarate/Fe(II)-dependent dioxygenase YbiX
MSEHIPNHGFSAEKDSIYLSNVEKIGNHSENILVVNDVISDFEHQILIDFCRNANFSGGDKDPNSQWYEKVIDCRQIPSQVAAILTSIFEVAETKIGHEYKVAVDPANLKKLAIVRWTTGDNMGPHVDDWSVHHYNIASIFYINDEYSGGEISFPEHNVTIKPKANSLVIFPGNSNYLHEVLQVTNGERYTSNMWFKFSGSTFKGLAPYKIY